MSDLPSSLTASDLAEHADFVQRLARRLAADEAGAEDLAQEAWVAALERRPEAGTSLRSWFARVLRNRSAMQLRTAGRRRAREAERARADVSDAAGVLVERMELHQRTIAAVLALPEAYRAAIVLRFLEGLSTERIAKELGVPHETARSRVRRGLAQLRERLAKDFPSRAAWSAALLDLGRHGLAGVRPVAASAVSATPLVLAAKLPLVALLLVASTAAIVWHLNRPAPSSVEPTSVTPVAAHEPDPEAYEGNEAAEVPTATSDERSLAPEQPEPPRTAETRVLPGSIVVVEPDGTERAPRRATFSVRFDEEEIDASRPVDAPEGRFELAIANATTVHVVQLVVDGLAGVLDSHEFEVPDSGELTIRTRLVPPVRLRVLDQASLADLDGVQVLFGPPTYKDRIHPGVIEKEHRIVAGASSPFDLPPRTGRAFYWIGAPGHGWKHVVVDHAAGGEREVLLPRGAQLTVRVDGLDPSIDVEVRLYPEDEERSMRCRGELRARDGEPVVFAGMAEGTYQLRAEIGHWWDPPLRLATETIELAAGDVRETVLSIDRALLGPAPVAVAGRLVLPPGRADLNVALKLEPRERAPTRRGDSLFVKHEDFRVDETDPHVLHFDAGEMSPGKYVAIVKSMQYAIAFEVPEAPLRDLLIELPQVGVVELDVIDAVTEEQLDIEQIAWSRRDRPSMRMWTLASETSVATGRFEFLAPLGTIAIHVDTPGYANRAIAVHVTADGTEAQAELTRLLRFTLDLRDGDAHVPGRWGESGFDLYTLEAAETGGRALSRGREYEMELDEGRWSFLVPEPDTYELHVPELDGFEAVEPITVDLRSGETEDVVVELRRKR